MTVMSLESSCSGEWAERRSDHVGAAHTHGSEFENLQQRSIVLRSDLEDARKAIDLANAQKRSLQAAVDRAVGFLSDQHDSPRSTDASVSAAIAIMCRVQQLTRDVPERVEASIEGSVVVYYLGRNSRYSLFECYNDGDTVVLCSDRKGWMFTADVTAVQSLNADLLVQIKHFLMGMQDEVSLE